MNAPAIARDFLASPSGQVPGVIRTLALAVVEAYPVEEWRPVKGYEGVFSVSSLGHVRREQTGTVMRTSVRNRTRYLGVRLVKDGKPDTMYVHILVAEAFLGPRTAGLYVNHRDGNKYNNVASNLEYTTRRINEDHAANLGLHAWGEYHAMSKLTQEQVREMRTSDRPTRYFADKFKLSMGAIRAARSGVTWRHLDRAGVPQ